MSTKKQKSKLAPRTNAEWVSLAISLLLLAAVVSLVIYLWLSSSNDPARFQVGRGMIRNEGGQFYLPIIVKNEGDKTGAQVTVEGRLTAGSEEETTTTTFDFIPGRSRVEGVLIFSRDPADARLRVMSYQDP
jgi:uncharacterized protein (TIGR02588 family)